MRVTGILSGTFDPMHRGHVAVAVNAIKAGAADEVLMLVSPTNPFKTDKKISSPDDRLAMARIMVNAFAAGYPVRVSDYEFDMPLPTYTITTLTRLRQDYPDRRFKLIIGADNLAAFGKWRESRRIIDEFGLIIYPRPGYKIPATHPVDQLGSESVILNEVPVDDVSATELRALAAAGSEGLARVARLTTPALADFIAAHGLYADNPGDPAADNPGNLYAD